MKKLPQGKIPIDVLRSSVLRLTGAGSEKVVTPAEVGVDFAAVKAGGGYLVVSADPITGVTKDIGRYAVLVSANDVATSGNRPQFAEVVILLPDGSSERDVADLAKEIHLAARGSRIALVGGHTEVTPGLDHPIVAVTVFSFVRKFVTSAGARPGDALMMTKTAGLEGTAELARERAGLLDGISPGTLRRAQKLISQVSVAEEAVAAFGTGKVHAMHDCTEGGVLGAVYEMSLASRAGFTLRERDVPVAPETDAICRKLSIDPLRLIGSGSLLLAVARGCEDEVEEAVKPICRVTRVGEFVRMRRTMIRRDGSRTAITAAPQDELWRVLSETSGGRDRP